MGAWVLFREMTGHEPGDEMAVSSVELCSFLYCTIKAACIGEGMDFDMSFEKFACSLTPAELQQWNAACAAEAAEQKKS